MTITRNPREDIGRYISRYVFDGVRYLTAEAAARHKERIRKAMDRRKLQSHKEEEE